MNLQIKFEYLELWLIKSSFSLLEIIFLLSRFQQITNKNIGI